MKDTWLWSVGDDTGSVGVESSNRSMLINTPQDLNVVARHVRMMTADGNYEFEHSAETPVTTLNSYLVGTPTRTPVAVGDYSDGQDLVSLIVRGVESQKSDLQEWDASGKVVSAIDGHGRLRLGGVTLTTLVVKGKAQLLAILPNGKAQVLAAAR